MKFEARNGNYERNAVVKNQETRQRGQRILGDCWQWEANNKRAKLTQPNPSPSYSTRQKEMHREPEDPEAKVPVEECLFCRARITSKELGEKWRPPIQFTSHVTFSLAQCAC